VRNIVIFICISLFAGVLSATENRFEQGFEQGIRFLESQDYDKAIAAFSDVLKSDPANFKAFHSRGIARFLKEDYDQAISDFTRAAEINPRYFEAIHSRGGAWLYKKEYDRAIADFTNAIEINPLQAEAFRGRGDAWFCKGDCGKAVADHTRALDINPKDAEAIYKIAWISATCPDAQYRDGEKAVAMAKKAIELNPGANFLDTLAASYAESGKFDEAVSTQEKAIALLDTKTSEEYLSRLDSYKKHKPWRENFTVPWKKQDEDEVKSEIVSEATHSPEIKTEIVSEAKHSYPEVETESVEKTEVVKKETPVSDTPGSDYPYTLHIFSYMNNKEMAARTVIRLKEKGIPAFSFCSDAPGKGAWCHVFVGYYDTFESARNAASELKAQKLLHSADAVRRPYSLWVGLSNSFDEIKKLEKELSQKGYAVYGIPGSQNLVRLLIGAFETKEEAEGLILVLEKQGIKTKVVKR